MRFEDTIEIQRHTEERDENLDYIETTTWDKLGNGKCTILPNDKAKEVKGNDGKTYVYAYEILMRKPKGELPSLGTTIHIRKKDGSIDTEKSIFGILTLRQYLKIWV